MKTAAGAPLAASEDSATVFLPAGAHGPAFLLFANFNVILKYNNAASYGLGVALLADRIMDRPLIKAAWPRYERALSRNERFSFQNDLATLGFDPGAADGVLGRRTRTATRAYQKSHGLVADGYPTAALLALLDTDAARKKSP